ncbi:MAG: tetratricopeptide repeat protein [Deltaproteobacteria bacterium]
MSQQATDAAEARKKIRRFHANMQRRDYFQLFGADPDTDADRLKASFHALAKRWHADAYTGMDLGPDKQKLDEIFQYIGEAYETLTDPKQRAEYMVRLDREKQGLSTDVNAILRAESIVDDAVAALRRRDWPVAKEKLEEAIDLNPDDPLYQAHHGWVMFHLGKKSEKKVKAAIDEIKAAVKKQESMPAGYNYLGQIYFSTDRPDEAKRWWRKCLEWEPNNVEAARGIRLINSRAAKKESGLGSFFSKLFKRS